MAKRYSGSVTVTITYNDAGDYRGRVNWPGQAWRFDGLRAPANGLGEGVAYDSSVAYDKMAQAAISFCGAEHEDLPVDYGDTDVVVSRKRV